MPTATFIDPPPVNSPTMYTMLVQQNRLTLSFENWPIFPKKTLNSNFKNILKTLLKMLMLCFAILAMRSSTTSLKGKGCM